MRQAAGILRAGWSWRSGRAGLVSVVLATILAATVSAQSAEEVLLSDNFAGTGSLDTQTKWKMGSDKAQVPDRANGTLLVTAGSDFHTRAVFDEPISVVFKGVWLARTACPSATNTIGIPAWSPENMVGFRFARGKMYALRYLEGKSWGEPDRLAAGGWGTPLGKIAARAQGSKASVAYDLRIDWWPGKLVRYYVNSKKVAEYSDHVMDTPSPIGVRDETAYFRIESIKVTKIAQSAGEVLDEPARKKEAARLAYEAMLRARSQARVQGIAGQFGKTRMVIGGPCYFWGIDPVIEDELKKAGMEVLAWPDAPLLDPQSSKQIGTDAMQFNVIIFGDSFYHTIQPDPNTGEMPGRIKNQVPTLRRFLNAGGGVWFCGIGEQNWGRSSHALNYILKELNLGAEVVGEVVRDSEVILGQGARYPRYCWVDVLRDPLTAGVENMLSPSGVIGGEGSMGVVPIVKLSPEWRVLVKGKATAASFPCEQVVGSRLLDTPGMVKSSPLLCAVRRAGKGRVVLWPTWTNFTVTGGSGGMVVDGEHGGRWSDGARLIENLLCWLAEPSQGSKVVGTFDPKRDKPVVKLENVEELLKNWEQPGRKACSHQYKGLIGAHSSLSDGKSSPDEMIAAVKKAGYDFIAFTEDFAKMDEAKWKQLRAACDKVNHADPNFRAYPGLHFLDEAGNRGVVFGQSYWIKDEWRSKQYPHRILWWYNLAYAADSVPGRWAPRVIIRSQTNNKRPWNQGLWTYFGAHCYEGGKLVDDSFYEWRPLLGPHAFFMQAQIMAFHTVRSTDEVLASTKPGLYHTYIRGGPTVKPMLSWLSGCEPGWPTGRCYVSAGPEILDFCKYIVVTQEGGFVLGRPDQDRGLLHLLVRSEAGLRAVAVYDGERLIRRYMPKGNRFEKFITFHPDKAHAFTITVTDKRGRAAHSWCEYAQVKEKMHRRCGDNWNWMCPGGTGPGTMRTPTFGYHLMEVTGGWQPRDLEPELPELGGVRYWNPMVNYGHGGFDAAMWGAISPRDQNLLVDGKPWHAPFSSLSLNVRTIGRFGVIASNDVTHELIAPKTWTPSLLYLCSSPNAAVPSPWPSELVGYQPTAKPDSDAIVVRYRGKVRFVQTVSTADGGPVQVRVGMSPECVRPVTGVVEVRHPDGRTDLRQLNPGAGVSGDIPDGGYVAWYGPGGNGLGAIIALEPGLKFAIRGTDLARIVVHRDVPSPVEPGTEVTFDTLHVSGSNPTPNSNQLIMDVWQGMGVAGKPTLYHVEPRLGRVIAHKVFLTVEAEDGGFSGRIVKTSEKVLPIRLPVMVRGLNTRWGAVIWYRGKANLHTCNLYRDPWTGIETYRWVVARYEPRVDEVKYIPILNDGTGYCQVETDKQDPDVFIGHPFVCDQPDVFLGLVEIAKGRCRFEINNPTEKPLTCVVRRSRGFELVGEFSKTIVLNPGQSRVVTAPTAEHVAGAARAHRRPGRDPGRRASEFLPR